MQPLTSHLYALDAAQADSVTNMEPLSLDPSLESESVKPVSLEEFWSWLELHANCITRVATPNAVLHDDESIHWYVGQDHGTWVIQMLRGKRIAGEIVIDASRLTHVLPLVEEHDEHGFEVIVEQNGDRSTACVFFLTHGIENDDIDGHSVSVH